MGILSHLSHSIFVPELLQSFLAMYGPCFRARHCLHYACSFLLKDVGKDPPMLSKYCQRGTMVKYLLAPSWDTVGSPSLACRPTRSKSDCYITFLFLCLSSSSLLFFPFHHTFLLHFHTLAQESSYPSTTRSRKTARGKNHKHLLQQQEHNYLTNYNGYTAIRSSSTTHEHTYDGNTRYIAS